LLADKGSPLSHKGLEKFGIEADVKAGATTGFIDTTIMNSLIAGTPGSEDYTDGGSYPIGEEFYLSIQTKQKALMNLFSKLHDGAMLDVTPPRHLNSGGAAGFRAFVRFESIDLPAHNPGNPFRSDYTVNLTADYIVGPDGQIDQADWETWGRWFVKYCTCLLCKPFYTYPL